MLEARRRTTARDREEPEKVALEGEFFIERKLYPNVDFYSGIIYRAMGIPTNMFTVMFALGRPRLDLAVEGRGTAGRASAARQIYIGETQRPYVRSPSAALHAGETVPSRAVETTARAVFRLDPPSQLAVQPAAEALDPSSPETGG